MATVDRDELPGLQSERTAMAWERTAFGLMGTGALLLLRDGARQPAVLVAALAALVLALVTTWIARRRAAAIQTLRSGSTPAPATEITVVTAGIVVLAVLIAIAAVVSD